jgi:hypothetical protein
MPWLLRNSVKNRAGNYVNVAALLSVKSSGMWRRVIAFYVPRFRRNVVPSSRVVFDASSFEHEGSTFLMNVGTH